MTGPTSHPDGNNTRTGRLTDINSMTFSELGLDPETLRRIEEVGYTKPTPIQEQAIPVVLHRRDVLGCAQTGTGKTASFVLPMIDLLSAGRSRARMPRSLILEPTRELAAQVDKTFESLGASSKLTTALLIGGEAFGDQVRKLDRGVDVLIATPGRMMDLFDRGNILLTDIRIFVVDEADRMLDMGFIPDIERIAALLPRERQTLMFSATMPVEIRRLADQFLNNPESISVTPPASAAETVEQAFALVQNRDKRKALRHLLGSEDVRNALIFCNRKRDVAILHRSLHRHGFNVGALHGDMPQSRRTETLQGFKSGEITLLVCSDVAARGLDIEGLSHVFNFDVPPNPDDYVHRIGRTGRAGRSGRSFTLATAGDAKQVSAIMRHMRQDIPQITIDGLEAPSQEETEESPRRRGRGKAKDQARDKDQSRDKDRGRERGRGGRGKPPEKTGPTDGGPATAGLSGRQRPAPSRRRHHEDEPDEPVVGFGDHIPAFMIQPARPSSSESA